MTHKTAILFVTVFLLATTSHVYAQASSKKPNIIFILADDLGYGDLGCYGSTAIQTPNIDALAKKGIRFTDFYSGSTVCAPSRASLMTGQHTGHLTIRGNGEVPLPAADSVLPQFLHKAGYVNGMVGKWGLGQANTTGQPAYKGWDFFSGLLHHVEGHYQLPDSAWQLQSGMPAKVKIPGNKYSNEWFKDEAIRFIEQQQQQPFFLYLSFTLPHAELNVPQVFLQPYLHPNGSSKFGEEASQRSNQHYGYQQYPKAAYAAMVSQMDYYIGEVVATLKKLHIEDETIIIFTSDNGTHAEGGRTRKDVAAMQSSGPLRGIKRDLYEGGIRVPFVVSWKNKIAAGTNSASMGAFWDVVPTLCEIAGATPTAAVDGVSLLPSLLGKTQPPRDCLYWEFYEGGFKQAIRKDNWKAIRFFKGTGPIKTELYDLTTDIGEQHNIAAQHTALVKQLELLMDREHTTAAHPLFQIK